VTGSTFADVLAARRMCRDFLDDPIGDQVLDRVLTAAFRGPAAGNTSALELVVLRGERVHSYWDLTLPVERRSTFPWPGLLSAPVLVVPVVDPGAYVERYAQPDKASTGLGLGEHAWSVPYWFVDGGAGVMAMLLAAEDAGLGALLFGHFEHEDAIAASLGVPTGRRALGTIALGHPAENGRRPSASARRGRPEPATLVHHQRW